MLYSYVEEALDQNWLNPTLVEVLTCGMDRIDRGAEPVDWPDCVPVDKRAALSGRSGFRDRLKNFWTAYKALSNPEKDVAREAIFQQTNLPDILTNDGPCTKISGLPASFVRSTDQLFKYMFGQLSTLKVDEESIRDLQYKAIYSAAPHKICPYCGLNYFRAPGAPRVALDHFLPISLYPFAGADLRNLAPACDECNSRFKKDKDVIWSTTGTRQRCSDPYGGPVFQVDLSASRLLAGNKLRGAQLPLWQINFVGGPPEQAEAWDSIYDIKRRYSRDVLDADLISWIEHFARWFVREFGRGKSADEVVDELPKYIDNVIQDGIADRAFLKAEAFRAIQAGCNDPHLGDDVRAWLWAFVEHAI